MLASCLFMLFFQDGVKDSWRMESDDFSLFFAQVQSSSLRPDGGLYLLTSDMKIVLVHPTGREEAVFGNPGKGPEEYEQCYQIAYLPDQDQLAALDAATDRLLLFARNGSFIERIQLFPRSGSARILTRDHYVVPKFHFVHEFASDAYDGQRYFWSTGEKKETKPMIRFSPEQRFPSRMVTTKDGGYIGFGFPWDSSIIELVSQDRRYLAIGSTLNLDMHLFDIETKTKFAVIKDPYPNRPLEPSDLRDYHGRASLQREGIDISKQPQPDRWPAVLPLLFDANHRLWVQVPKHVEEGQSARIVVYDLTSTKLGSLQLPNHEQLLAAKNDSIWVLGDDPELDSVYLARRSFKLESP